MKNLLLAALLLTPSASHASPYLAPCFEKSAGFLIAPKTPGDSAGVVDLAFYCHQASPTNTIVPEAWQGFIHPETWAFQVSLGGDFNGRAIVAPGISANVSPMLATSLLHWADEKSSSSAGQVKSWMLGKGATQFRLGGGLYPHLIEEGRFQSFNGMLPGHGFFDIIGKAARVNVGLAW